MGVGHDGYDGYDVIGDVHGHADQLELRGGGAARGLGHVEAGHLGKHARGHQHATAAAFGPGEQPRWRGLGQQHRHIEGRHATPRHQCALALRCAWRRWRGWLG